ncbi:MAG TPA: CsbD family protein [Acidimicrobiales bacterium]|nr:CsbD family protein [Acidimicrobiales bacterium]
MDKIKNMLQSTKGQAKKRTGKATGDRSLEAEGKGDEVAGNLKQAGENVKDAFKQ